MRLDPKNRIYYLQDMSDSSLIKRHWAVGDGTSFYIHIGSNKYFKMDKVGNTFSFTIPHTVPDMYALLSLEEISLNRSASSLPRTGSNILGLLGAVVIRGISENIATGEAEAWAEKIRQNGLKSNLRYCLINLDNGDIIYLEVVISP